MNPNSIWVAPLLDSEKDSRGNTINVYDKPFQLNAMLNTTSGSYEIELYGERAKRICKAMLNVKEYLGKIKEGDKAYLYGVTPKGESKHGVNANYKVISVRPQNVKMVVLFEQLPAKKG